MTVLIGREAELTSVGDFLDAVASGPAGLALEGAPGIGKSAIWRAAVAGARDRGLLVLPTAPSEPDHALPFAGLGDLLDAVPPSAVAVLSATQRAALSAALGVADDAADRATPDVDVLPRTVLRLLRGLAASTPVLVAIDDEQWLDRASARVLGFVLRRLMGARVGVLLARRTGSTGTLWSELSHGADSPEGLARVAVAPLGLPAIHELLAARLPGVLSPTQVRRVHETSGGNPLHALSIAREIASAAVTSVAPHAPADPSLPIPASLGEAIERRLARLGHRAAAPLLVVAATSEASLALIAAAVPGFRPSDLDDAERADVVLVQGDRVTFTHPLLRSTTYARAASGERRELHRRLADLVEGVEQRARHLALGAVSPDAAVAESLADAARAARARGAPEIAAELFEAAARLTPSALATTRLMHRVDAAIELRIAGDIVRCRRLLEEAIDTLPAGHERARALHQLALVRTDEYAAARRLLESALAEVGGEERLAAEIESALAELCANGGEHAAAVAHGDAAIARAERSGDRGILATTLAMHGVMAFFNGDGIQETMMSRARTLEPEVTGTSYGLPSTALGLQLLWSDQPDAARPLLRASLQRAEERGEDVDHGGLLFHLAHLEWEAGQVEEAARLSDRVAATTAFLADPQLDAYAAWLRAYRDARTGRLVAASDAARAAVALAERIGDSFIASFAGTILAAVDLWSGRPADAHARVAPLRATAGEHTFIGALTIPFWSCDAEALIALGRHDEARELADALDRRARQAENPNARAIAHRCRGLAYAAVGETAAAVDEMDAALAAHHERPLPLPLARTWLEKGSLERRARRKSAAKHSLEQALRILEPLEAPVWATRARDELSRIGLRRAPARVGLTAAERRVAELAAAGLTTRQIADALHMSTRTVETHLTRVYRGLGVSSRAQIGAALTSAATDPDAARESA